MVSKLVFWLLILLIILLPSQLALHFWPSYSLIGSIRIDYLSPTLYLTDIIIIALLLVVRPKIRLNRDLAVFLVFIMINILASVSPWVSVYKFSRIMLYLGLYLSLVAQKKLFFKVIQKTWPLMLFWVSFLAISQFATRSDMGGLWYWLGERPLDIAQSQIAKISLGNYGLFLRPYSTLPHPNALAGFLALCLVVLVTLRSKIKPLIFRLVFLISSLALVLTFSRGAFIALFVSGLFIGLPYYFFLLILILTGILFVIGSSLAISDRWQQFPALLTLLKSHSLFGIGLGAYPYAVRLIQMPYRIFSLTFQPFHNTYLLLLAEIGLSGCLYITYLINKIRIKLSGSISSPLFFIIIFIAVTSLLDHYWLTSVQNLLLVFIIFAYFTDFSQND